MLGGAWGSCSVPAAPLPPEELQADIEVIRGSRVCDVTEPSSMAKQQAGMADARRTVCDVLGS